MRLNKRDIFEGCSSCNDERINELLQRLKEEVSWDPDFFPGLFDRSDQDSDGDGYPDWVENLKGTDPNDPNSTPFEFEDWDDWLEWYESQNPILQIILQILIAELGWRVVLLFIPGGGIALAAGGFWSFVRKLVILFEIYEGAQLLQMISELVLEFFGLESNVIDLIDCLLSGGTNCFDAYKPEDFDITQNPLDQKQFPDVAPSRPKPVITPLPNLPDDLPPPTQPFGPGGNNPIP